MLKRIFLISILFTAILNVSSAQVLEVAKSEAMEEKLIIDWNGKIMYEIFIRAFADGNGDGIGDFIGLTKKIPYLKELGVEGVWLLPFNKATSYHKYDITDYYGIDPDYGTQKDFDIFIQEAHKAGLVVVMDLVLNHCGEKHPWFVDASKNRASKFRDYFVWSDSSKIKTEVKNWYFPKDEKGKIIRGQKYYGFFWSGMPDWNFDNKEWRMEAMNIGKHWLNLGIDGYRLDAAQHIYPDVNDKRTHEWWRQFRAEMEKVNPSFYMVGEIYNEDTVVAPYLQKGMNAAFNFDLAKNIISSLNAGKSTSLIRDLLSARDLYYSFEPNYIDATFISNHDQDRFMTVFKNNMRKAKLAVALLFTLPGSPYLYYGEEIGMQGMKPDERIREPFIWSTSNPKEAGQSRWTELELNNEKTVTALDIQQKDKNSLYSFYKDLISIRKNSAALYSGDLNSVESESASIISFTRSAGAEQVLVVMNINEVSLPANVPDNFLGGKILYQSSDMSIEESKVSIPGMSFIVIQAK